jgi:hypothetical protein
VDTIEPWRPGTDEGTGILFEPYTASALLGAVESALSLYADPPLLGKIRKRGMTRDFSWEASARRYLALYRQANAVRRMGTGYHRWLSGLEPGAAVEGPGGWTPPGPPLTGRKDGV